MTECQRAFEYGRNFIVAGDERCLIDDEVEWNVVGRLSRLAESRHEIDPRHKEYDPDPSCSVFHNDLLHETLVALSLRELNNSMDRR
jgi:hypothetical protein